MRARLVIVVTIPIVLLFVVLGAAYAASVARSGQQELFLDRLRDANYLTVSARHALASDDPAMIEGELERYGHTYGVDAAVLNQAGETWASNGLNVTPIEERFAALAGRRAELSETFLPWRFGDLIVAEPVFERGGDLVGAVVTSSSTDRLAGAVWRQWALLTVGGIGAVVVSVLVAYRLASWVLRPVRLVDTAMAEMGSGYMGARIPESSGPPELRQAIAQFNTMAEKVEELMHKQAEFVSNASHELRNPLNALLLRVEDLGLALPSASRDEIEQVRMEGRRMTGILDALLMLARDEDMAAESGSIELGTLVADRVDGWRSIAHDQDIELHLECPAEVWARMDAIVLESAFDAVADNAVKFSPRGGAIEVSVSSVDRIAEVVVRDHGPGLPPAEIQKVTDRFWRSPAHRAVRGSGLGLAIAAELLDSCGGELGVERADGDGLVVSLRVPQDVRRP